MSAVEFLVQELFNNGYFYYGIPDEIVEQAKQMEINNIIDSNIEGFQDGIIHEDKGKITF